MRRMGGAAWGKEHAPHGHSASQSSHGTVNVAAGRSNHSAVCPMASVLNKAFVSVSPSSWHHDCKKFKQARYLLGCHASDSIVVEPIPWKLSSTRSAVLVASNYCVCIHYRRNRSSSWYACYNYAQSQQCSVYHRQVTTYTTARVVS
eukprot:6192011-Amphidinium_carterae.2